MTDTKSCSYCGSEIPIRAAVCPVCKYQQTRWRNNLLFVAGLAGLITLFVSGLAFTVDRLSLAYKSLVWQDRINVLQFHAVGEHFDYVIANSGDGPIFVSEIEISSGADTGLSFAYSRLFSISKPLDPNAFVVGEKGDRPHGFVVANESGTLSPEMSTSTTSRLDTYGTQFCYLLVLDNENSPQLAMNRHFHASELGLKVVSFRVLGHVGFFSPHSNTRIEQKFAVTGSLIRHPDCKPKS
jgi:hypothetical protein